jgi:hypothetical protein
MNYNFSRCPFDPLCKEPMVDAYPKLRTIFSTNCDEIIRYVIMMYDSKSPLIEEERDLNRRKTIAVEMSGIVMPEREEMFEPLHEAIIEYLQFTHDRLWAAAVSTEFRFWEAIRIQLQPIKGSTDKEQLEAAQKKNVLADSIDDCMKRIDAYAKEMSGGDEKVEKKVKKRLSPEEIANGKMS